MSELTLSLSLWLPIGQANFYSATANGNGWLQLNTGLQKTTAESDLLKSPGYVPRLQVSVLRRMLEVLPVSFGYDATGVCEMSSEGDLLARPVAVTMTLRSVGGKPRGEGQSRACTGRRGRGQVSR